MALTDLPTLIGSALGTTPEVGGMLLAIAIIVMVALVLSSVKLPTMPSTFVIVGVATLTTALGWLPLGVLVLGVIAIVVAFLLLGARAGGRH